MAESSRTEVHINKLSDNNYQTWKVEMKWYLKSKGLLDYVTGKIKIEGTATLEQKKAFQVNDDKAIAPIGLHIEPNQQIHIEECNTAEEAWKALEQVHQPKSRVRIMQLKKQLYGTKMKEGDSMSSYISSIKVISNNLREAGAEVQDEDLAYILLAGLPESYETLNMTLANLPDNSFTTAEISKALLSEYDRRRSRHPEENESQKEALQIGRKPKHVSPTTFNTSNIKQKPVFCSHCKKQGHDVKSCWSKNRARTQYHNPNCNHKRKENDEGFLVSLNNIDMGDSWLLDSGCTHHVCKRRDWFKTFKEVKLEPINTAADSHGQSNAQLEAKGVGDIEIKAFIGRQVRYITLHNVYYVPHIRKNLLSASQIEQRSKEILIREGKAEIYNMKNGQLMCIADRINDLYIVRARTIVGTEEKIESHNINIRNSTLWHQRLCHIGRSIIDRTAELECVRGLEDTKIEESACGDCCIGKSTKAPCRRVKDRQSKEICELIHSDVCGPMPSKSLSDKLYFITFTDDYSRHITVAFIKSKDEVKDHVKKYIANAELQTGKRIKRFRSDNGTEYCNRDLKAYFEEKGIKHETSNVETPQMNGIAERVNRTLLDLVRSMLKSAQLPKKFWAEAVAAAAYVKNRVWHTSTNNRVPLTIWSGKIPSVRHLKAYGSLAYAHLTRQGQRKLDDRAIPCILVGYSTQTRGYRLWCPEKGDVIVTKHVRFSEDKMGYDWLVNRNPRYNYPCTNVWSDEEEEKLEFVPELKEIEETDDCASMENKDTTTKTVGEEITKPKKKVGRPKKKIRNPYGRKGKPKETNSDTGSSDEEGSRSVELNFVEIVEPNTLEEALSSPQASEWKQAIHDEMTSLIQRTTWENIDHLPPGRRCIDSKWVFRLKKDCKGNISKYKARLVARGFSQQKGIDYNETYSPVANFCIIRVLIAIAEIFSWYTRQLDIKCAYLYGELHEEIYMKLAPHRKDGKEKLVKLKRPIYGLKQAGRNWNTELNNFLVTYGFTRLNSSSCVYRKGYWIIAIVYVDDIFLFSNDSISVNNFVKAIGEKYETKDLGEIGDALGVSINRDCAEVTLDQRNYIESLLAKYNMIECKSASTPLDPSLKTSRNVQSNPLDEKGRTAYRELIGCLMYTALRTRPDILHAATKLSQYNSHPCEVHWTQCKHILRYLHRTRDYKIIYKTMENPKIKIFCDADWAGDLDDRHSYSGMIVTIGSNIVHWTSSKQKSLSTSTMEAEYVALASGVKEAIWLRTLLTELDLYEHLSGSCEMFCDNRSAIDFSKSRIENTRTKHIDISYHIVREELEKGTISLSYISSNENLADIMTKPLKSIAHKNCVQKLKLEIAKVGD